MRIGIMDSGSGGLTVAREVQKAFPHAVLIYYGDHGNCPYGGKNVEEITELTWRGATFLLGKNIDLLVVACNTASAILLDELKKDLGVPVIGMIEAGVAEVYKEGIFKKVGVIATEATVETHMYKMGIEKAEGMKVYEQSCPKLVEMIESPERSGENMHLLLEEYLQGLLWNKVDLLVFGCTHYPMIEREVRRVMGEEVRYINPAKGVVDRLRDYMRTENIDLEERPASSFFYTTGDSERFKRKIKQWIHIEDPQVEKIEKKVHGMHVS